jgi:hypothetical protein
VYLSIYYNSYVDEPTTVLLYVGNDKKDYKVVLCNYGLPDDGAVEVDVLKHPSNSNEFYAYVGLHCNTDS